MIKFKQWLYGLTQPYLINFLSLIFPNTDATMVQHDLKIAAVESNPKIRHGDLLSKYHRFKNPQSSFRIFYLRVKYLGWDVAHALRTLDRTDEITVVGHRYNLREIYNNSLNRSVPYPLFYHRVVRQGWSPIMALTTSPKKAYRL